MEAAAVALFLLSIFVGPQAKADDTLVVSRQVVAEFDSGVVLLPEGQDSAALQDVTITIPEIENSGDTLPNS